MTAPELAGALERAAVALESDDPTTASAALAEARRACATVEALGNRIDRAELDRLCVLHRRGEAVALRAIARLAEALGSASSARRALSAYRR
jgi:hypothetical protein